MIVAIDALYFETSARVAAVVFDAWDSDEPELTSTLCIRDVSEYIPGKFYLRELDPILTILRKLPPVETIVIDGYCYLNDSGEKGLGAYVNDATESQYQIIGVAKNPFMGSRHAIPVFRGHSRKPLFVTSIGVDKELAATYIKSMAGAYRMPSILKLVDTLSRGNRS